jgi:dienelactone hydrolase
VIREDTTYQRAGETLEASLYRPARAKPSLPGWVALHGLTRRGRDHESLEAFARALAASGTVVLVPDLPEWRALLVAPDAAMATIKAAVATLADHPATAADRVGVIGFSFGGTEALIASTDPVLQGRLAAVATWGAYADLRRAARYMFVGSHDLDGESYYREPDPYGRWILAGNYLADVPQQPGDTLVAAAVLDLAREVGQRKLMAWEAATDPLKQEIRARLGRRERALFDLLAPPAGTSPTDDQREQLRGLADRIAMAAAAREPLLDPAPYLPAVPVPVFLAHGREDRLVPWTELVRLRRAVPKGRVRHAFVTGLFAHSFRERRFPSPALVAEAVRFVRGINRMVHLV